MSERKAEPLSAEEITELRGWDNHTTITRLLATLDESRAALAQSEASQRALREALGHIIALNTSMTASTIARAALAATPPPAALAATGTGE